MFYAVVRAAVFGALPIEIVDSVIADSRLIGKTNRYVKHIL